MRFSLKGAASHASIPWEGKNGASYLARFLKDLDFADCPEHTHLFLEANYLLSGQATETVAGKDLALKAGDLLLLDVGTPHAIQALGKDDLLINLIFSETADFSFAQLIPGRKAEYLVFRHDQAKAEIQTVADLLIAKFWSKNPSKNLLHHYLGALKVLLLRDAATSTKASQQSPIVSQMLKEISENFKTTSLKKFAEKYGCSPKEMKEENKH